MVICMEEYILWCYKDGYYYVSVGKVDKQEVYGSFYLFVLLDY